MRDKSNKLVDIDFTGMAIHELCRLERRIRQAGNDFAANFIDGNPPGLSKAYLGGSWELNAEGAKMAPVSDWLDTQHDRVITELRGRNAANTIELAQRAETLVAWDMSCGEWDRAAKLATRVADAERAKLAQAKAA